MFEKMKAIEKAGLERKTVAVGCSSTVNFKVARTRNIILVQD